MHRSTSQYFPNNHLGHSVAKIGLRSSRVRSGHWQPTPVYPSDCLGNIEIWSDAYDFPLLESVKIFEFDLRFPWGTRSRRSVALVEEFDRDIGSLHQYTQVIVWEILRCGAMHMTSYSWNLSNSKI